MISTPRLEIDLKKIQHNTQSLVERLLSKGISVSGVSKVTLGDPEITRALLRGGLKSIGDSRIENIIKMREAEAEAGMGRDLIVYLTL